ncbi:MAG TPA: glycosyltransferase [Candidatus Bathyarchaeia archaeon]|nr:glycosyltransferase [Candidatus Bathyarchaeia archaeon]
MKILALASTLDLKYGLGCTPSWWQLLKGFHETGNEVIAIPYLGDPVESLWWRTYGNPCSWQSRLFNVVSKWEAYRVKGKAGVSATASKFLVSAYIRPRWRKHLDYVLSKEKDVDFVFMMNMPVNHFTGLPSHVRDEYGVKVAYYDGDMPTILPHHALAREFKFSYYEGADLSEYDVFFSNSMGAIPDIRTMGAKDVRPLYWAADPELCQPLEVVKDYDVSFYGHGSQLREEWLAKLISEPSQRNADIRFVVGGRDFDFPLGRAELVGPVPYSEFGRFVSRSKVNLNITRSSHTTVYASATSRPFELAAFGACMVSQPYDGIQEWFEIGKELLIARSTGEAEELYRSLLDDRETAAELGRRARERILKEHTFHHRAQEVVMAVQSVG